MNSKFITSSHAFKGFILTTYYSMLYQLQIDYHNVCKLEAQALATLEYPLGSGVTIQPLLHFYLVL